MQGRKSCHRAHVRRSLYGDRVKTPADWYVPGREELLPIAPEQQCVICGSRDWRYIYLLLNAPRWVQELPWVINWFVAMCDSCHSAFQAGDDIALAAASGDGDPGASSPDVTEFLRVLRVRVSEPALSRD